MSLPPLRPGDVRALVFDLDGTLYVSRPFSREIFSSVQVLVASHLGLSPERAGDLMRATKKELAAATGSEATLTSTCVRLGISPRELHRHMAQTVHPENFLSPDDRVVRLLQDLRRRFTLVLYTNNNRTLCRRILERIGCGEAFDATYTIEDFWHPKPWRPALERVFADLDMPPGNCLFVGDRSDIDLKLPLAMGAQAWWVRELDDLLALDTLLIRRSGK